MSWYELYGYGIYAPVAGLSRGRSARGDSRRDNHTSHGMSMSERQTGKATARLRNPPAHVWVHVRTRATRMRRARERAGSAIVPPTRRTAHTTRNRRCRCPWRRRVGRLRALPAPPEREERARAVAAVAARRCRQAQRAAAMLRHARRASTKLPMSGSRVGPDGRTRMRPGGNLNSGSRRRRSVDTHDRSSREPSSRAPAARRLLHQRVPWKRHDEIEHGSRPRVL